MIQKSLSAQTRETREARAGDRHRPGFRVRNWADERYFFLYMPILMATFS